MSFVSARRTALVEPGMATMSVPPATPATARESIAAAPDLLPGEHAEELAEAVDPLLEHPGDGVVGRVARGDACSAIREHRLDVVALRSIGQDLADLLRFVRNDPVVDDLVPGEASVSRINAPEVSVSGVRVSLTVSTAQRTESGAAARCASTSSSRYSSPER